MTTFLEPKSWAQAAVGDVDGIVLSSADWLRYGNAAQREICRRGRILQKVLSGAQTLTTFDTYGGLLLPTDFYIEEEVYYGSPLVRLTRLPWDVFWGDSMPATGVTDQPTSYTISDYLTGAQNNQRHMLFYPYLATGLTNQMVRVGYSAAPSTITADGDVLQIPDQYVEVMALMMQANARMQLDDFTSAAALKKMAEDRFISLSSEFMDTSGLANREIRYGNDQVYAAWEG